MNDSFRTDRQVALLAIDFAGEDIKSGEFKIAKKRLKQAVRALKRIIERGEPE